MSGARMRAGFYTRTGPAAEVLEIGQIERPEPGPDEVLVRVAFSGVNPSDVKARAGARGPAPFPRVVPHSDGAGIVEAVGANVPAARIGERVWLWNAAWQRPGGSNAEYVALPAAQAVPLPESASLEAGACLGIPAMTAHACVFSDGPVAGQWVMVTGGAGSVGAYAVRMARLGGARVIATVSSEAKAAQARAAGAETVIDYRREDVAERVRAATEGRGVARIVEVEFGGNLAISRQVLAQGGVIAAYGSMADPEPRLPFYPMMFASQTLRMMLIYILPPEARAHAVADITRWLAEGALSHRIARRFALEQTAEAHAFVEAGARSGAVLVEMDGDAPPQP